MTDRKSDEPTPPKGRQLDDRLGINSIGVRQPDLIVRHPGVRQPSSSTKVGTGQPKPATPPPSKK